MWTAYTNYRYIYTFSCTKSIIRGAVKWLIVKLIYIKTIKTSVFSIYVLSITELLNCLKGIGENFVFTYAQVI